MNTCRICGTLVQSSVFAHKASYFFCQRCHSWQMIESDLPKQSDEVNRYAEHNNVFSDVRYRSYLQQFIDVVKESVDKGANGIDVGAGEHKVLCRLMCEQGYAMHAHDPLYGYEALNTIEEVDFVVSIETVEHFHFPLETWTAMVRALKPNGKIFVSTNLYDKSIEFSDWWYIMDPTHVCMYSLETMQYIANVLNVVYTQQGKMSIFTIPS